MQSIHHHQEPTLCRTAGVGRVLGAALTTGVVGLWTTSSAAPTSDQLSFRSLHASDRDALRAFLERLSPATVHARFLMPAIQLTGDLAERELDRVLEHDERNHTVVVALDGNQIRALGEFVVEDIDRAELALVVEDEFQGRGVGRRLLRNLEELARTRGIRVFSGDIAHDNSRALKLLRQAGQPAHLKLGYGGVRFSAQVATHPALDGAPALAQPGEPRPCYPDQSRTRAS